MPGDQEHPERVARPTKSSPNDHRNGEEDLCRPTDEEQLRNDLEMHILGTDDLRQ